MSICAPIRVLHVVGRLDRAGIETWLLEVFRKIDRRKIEMDILAVLSGEGDLDSEIEKTGARIFHIDGHKRWIQFSNRIQEFYRKEGPYHILHTHVDVFGGALVRLGHQLKIPFRLAHSHADTRLLQQNSKLSRKLYYKLMQHWLYRYATHFLAVSQNAGYGMFPKEWGKDQRSRLQYCGIDLDRFTAAANSSRASLRSEFGIPADGWVVGHVGRFEEPKNHRFILKVAESLCGLDSRIHFLLVGKGSLENEMRQIAQADGLKDRVHFAGIRGDVPEIMMSAMDAFLFPSPSEGLGLVLVEAQAAGLKCLITDNIPAEVELIPNQIERLPLAAGHEAWAQRVFQWFKRGNSIQLGSASIIACSPFNIDKSIEGLQALYQEIALN